MQVHICYFGVSDLFLFLSEMPTFCANSVGPDEMKCFPVRSGPACQSNINIVENILKDVTVLWIFFLEEKGVVMIDAFWSNIDLLQDKKYILFLQTSNI